MPKKFIGENTKATAALHKRSVAKEAANAKKKIDLEDSFWRDDNKQIVKKQHKKDEEVKKKKTIQEKKAETKEKLEKELESFKKSPKINTSKVTRAQIQSTNLAKKEPKKYEKFYPLEENINRTMLESEVARTVTDAICILEKKGDAVDKHPEKRMKAAYAAYETRRLKELKVDQPTLRQSQLKQIIYKEWQKSPENPLRKI